MRQWVCAAALLSAACATVSEKEHTERRAEALLAETKQRRGNLELHCEPADAEVFVDGVPQGACFDFDGTTQLLKVGEGLHRIDVKKSGFWPYQTYFHPSGAKAVLRIALEVRGQSQGEAP